MDTDQDGIVERQKDVLPQGWFPIGSGTTPVLDIVLNGFAAVGAWLFLLLQYVSNQMRLPTSNDGWLEIAALDYFGEGNFPRLVGESDPDYAQRIEDNLLPKADTRQAVSDAIEKVTGKPPRIVEYWNPADTGVWDGVTTAITDNWDDGSSWDTGGNWDTGLSLRGAFFWDVDTSATPFRWTGVYPYQAFIDATLPRVPILDGNPVPSWDSNFYWDSAGSSLMDIGAAVPRGKQIVYDAIRRVKVAGTKIWVRFGYL